MAFRIALVGAPSCRKTTTSEQVKINLKLKRINAEIAPEYARTYIRETGAITSISEQVAIFHGQVEMEENLARLHEVVISDSSSFLGYVYATLLDNGSSKDFYVRELLHKLCIPSAKRYHQIYLLRRSGDAVFQDGVRTQTDEDQIDLENRIYSFMVAEGIPFKEIPGELEVAVKAGLIAADYLNIICHKAE